MVALLAGAAAVPALAAGGPMITVPGALDLGAGAEAGDPTAQYNMGVAYLAGLGVKADPAEARRWFEKAARHGEREAQAKLAQLWEIGLGGPRDAATALTWYRRAAERGHVEAQRSAGRLLAHGDGVPRDTEAARTWLERAIAQGDAGARFELSLLLADGPAARRDPARAAALLREAALELDAARLVADKATDAPMRAALAALYGIGGPIDRKAAVAAFTRLARAGRPAAMYYLSEAEANGWVGPPRESEATAWLEKALRGGYLGALVEAGQNTSDRAHALGWLRTAARSGWAQAAYALGAHLFQEDATRAEGRSWLARAAAKGHPMAAWLATTSGQMGAQSHHQPTFQERKWLELAASCGIAQAAMDYADYWLYSAEPRRPAEAIRWLARAASAGELEAARRLGEFYTQGRQVPMDAAKAFQWYLVAMRGGDSQALSGLCQAARRAPASAPLPWAELRRELDAAIARGETQYLPERAELVRRGRGEPADPARARTLLLAAAEKCTDWAQATAWAALGDMAAAGEGGPRDDAQALAWYRRATEVSSGHPHSAVMVALMTRAGRGVKADPAGGLALLEKAIVSNGEAMGALGTIYLTGDGVAPDLEKALHNLKLAAANDWPEARARLLDIDGDGARLRRVDGARYWPELERKAAQGDLQAATTLGRGLFDRAYDRQEVAAGRRWLERAAKAGHVPAMIALADVLDQSQVLVMPPSEMISSDRTAAAHWRLAAAKRGDHDAQVAIAWTFLHGEPRRPAEAFNWAREGVKGGSAEAFAQLGYLYAHGVGTPVDGKQALMCYEAALRLGEKSSYHAIAELYAEGRGVPRDPCRAFDWYRRGAEAGYGPCKEEVARRYEQGEGVARDLRAAIAWYEKAFDSTNHEPAYAIARILASGPAELRNPRLALRWYLDGLQLEGNPEDEARKFGEDDLGGFRAQYHTIGEARFALAEALRDGDGLPRDPVAAVEWFEHATFSDDLPGPMALKAHLAVAEAYDAGAGVAADPGRAKEHYRDAAAAIAAAYVNPFAFLGRLEAHRAFDRAFDVVLPALMRAAEAGYAPAQFELGWLFRNGRGVPVDDVQAQSWLARARAQGYPLAMPGLEAAEDGSGGADDEPVTAETLAAFRAMAANYRAKASPADLANGGHGTSPPEVYGQALQALDEALKQGRLGRYRQPGQRPGVIELVMVPNEPLTPEQLKKWATSHGISVAEASFYWQAAQLVAKASMAKTPAERFALMRQAADFGSGEAMVKLVKYYVEGEGTPADHTQAYKWACLARAVGAIAGPVGRLTEGLTPQQVADGQREAAAWWRSSMVGACVDGTR